MSYFAQTSGWSSAYQFGPAGGIFLAAGGKTTTIEGEPPKSRVVIQQWDSVEKIQAYRDSAAFKDLLPMRDRLAKFRSFAVGRRI